MSDPFDICLPNICDFFPPDSAELCRLLKNEPVNFCKLYGGFYATFKTLPVLFTNITEGVQEDATWSYVRTTIAAALPYILLFIILTIVLAIRDVITVDLAILFIILAIIFGILSIAYIIYDTDSVVENVSTSLQANFDANLAKYQQQIFETILSFYMFPFNNACGFGNGCNSAFNVVTCAAGVGSSCGGCKIPVPGCPGCNMGCDIPLENVSQEAINAFRAKSYLGRRGELDLSNNNCNNCGN